MSIVYKSLNRELTVLGVERKLMLLPAFGWWAVFFITAHLLAGIAVGIVLYVVCRLATAVDPRIGSILFISLPLKHAYDPLNVNERARAKEIEWV